ncbi:methionine ABC transporter permease [Macrococcus animalis]|uniref:methionine ABC transporter permease n=1 Tax=Macrococcus animalis TaxID=3395467 RepID=UPI0039BEBABC
MSDTFQTLLPELYIAFLETILMSSIAITLSVIIGLPLGILLYLTRNQLLLPNGLLNSIVGFIVNIIRSFPFIILMVAILPFAAKIVGQSHGPYVASVALTLAAVPLLARLIETSLKEVDKGVIEACVATGASLKQIIMDVLIPESMSGIFQAITLSIISILAYSATAGVIGGGGIGDLAIRYGYYRYDNVTMIVTVIILILLVQLIQLSGDFISKRVDKR